MDAHVQIARNRRFTLKSALLIYGDDASAFATIHNVRSDPDGAPYLSPGRPLTNAFLRKLAKGLGTELLPEFLPKCVLARSRDLIVWWTEAKYRLMFFGGSEEEVSDLNGHTYPHPPLVFKVCGRELFVRALSRNIRPTPTTRLKTAPYWNTHQSGEVCTGSMPIPVAWTLGSVFAWEEAYFRSEFTHAAGAVRLTKYAGGFRKLWMDLRDQPKHFPTRTLIDAEETLSEFIEGSEGR
jgi:PRTRC genetic system protein B